MMGRALTSVVRVVSAAQRAQARLGRKAPPARYRETIAQELTRVGFDLNHDVTQRSQSCMCGEPQRVDLIVNKQILVEFKHLPHLTPIHDDQLVALMTLMEMPYGLLFNMSERLGPRGLRLYINQSGRIRRHSLEPILQQCFRNRFGPPGARKPANFGKRPAQFARSSWRWS